MILSRSPRSDRESLDGRWDGVVRLRGDPLEVLAAAHGGHVVAGVDCAPLRFVPVGAATAGDLAPVLATRALGAARAAADRGAALLVDASVAGALRGVARAWVHDSAAWAMAEVLDRDADVPDLPASVGEGSVVSATAVLGPRVVLGARVVVGAGAVIGHPGFGWATSASGVRPIPQLGGVVVEDDVSIGPLCTIDAGTLSPTRLRRGVKLDAHVHVGHNCDLGEGCMVAAQAGFAGSVTLGRRVLVGGQAGVADHVTVGDDARLAGGCGVIGDVPAGSVVAGYPAVPRVRWLRALARLYRGLLPPGDW